MTKYIKATYMLEVSDDQEAQTLRTLRGLPDVFNVHVKFTDVSVGTDHDALFRKLRDRFIVMMQTHRSGVEQVFYSAEDSDTQMLASWACIGDASGRIYYEGRGKVTWGVPATWNCERTEALLNDGTRVPF